MANDQSKIGDFGSWPDSSLVSGSSLGARDLWIFAYGSLMWRPGFFYEEAVRAQLAGYRRCFCIYSVHHRGTRTEPGLVLGLDRGGVCEGLAFRVPPDAAQTSLRYLREREQVTAVYREALLPVMLHDGRRTQVRALTYLVERRHPSYAGSLPLAAEARLIRWARGRSGANIDYFAHTVERLRALDVRERRIERLVSVIGPVAARARAVAPAPQRAKNIAPKPVHARCATPRLKPDQLRRFAYRARVARMSAAFCDV